MILNDGRTFGRRAGLPTWYTPDTARGTAWNDLPFLEVWDRPHGSIPCDPLNSLTLPPGCRQLSIEATELTPLVIRGIQRVPECPSLERCIVNVPSLSDAEAEELGCCPLLKSVRELDICCDSLTAHGLRALVSSEHLGNVTALYLRRLSSTEKFYDLIRDLPSLAKLESFTINLPLLPDLNRGDEGWRSQVSPDRGPVRFECCEVLFDRERFPLLRVIHAGEDIWRIDHNARILDRGEIRNEPGIDFL